MDTYADWYKDSEQPEMSNAELYAAGDFMIMLVDQEQILPAREKSNR